MRFLKQAVRSRNQFFRIEFYFYSAYFTLIYYKNFVWKILKTNLTWFNLNLTNNWNAKRLLRLFYRRKEDPWHSELESLIAELDYTR